MSEENQATVRRLVEEIWIKGNLSVFRQPKSIEIPRAHNFAELLKHPRADLQTERNNLINWQAGTSCMFAASLAVGHFELAEEMFAVYGKMASNPLNARHLATDCDHLAPNLIELDFAPVRKMHRKDFDGHGAIEARLTGAVDLTHSSRTYSGEDFIGNQALVRLERHLPLTRNLAKYNL